MLSISSDQMRAISERLLQDFKDRAKVYLRQRFPEERFVLSDQQLSALINNSLIYAKPFKLSRERDIVRFLEIVCRHLGGVVEKCKTTEALIILCDHRVATDEKLERFDQWAKSNQDQ